MKRVLRGAPVVSGPTTVESYRETVANGVLLTTSHDGYLARFGVVHRRVLMVAQDGSRLVYVLSQIGKVLELTAIEHRIDRLEPVSYTHLRAHETVLDLVCRLLLEKKKLNDM